MALCLQEHSDGEESTMEVCDAEILDEYTTHRGELKLRTASTFSDDRRYQVRYLLPCHFFSYHSCPTIQSVCYVCRYGCPDDMLKLTLA